MTIAMAATLLFVVLRRLDVAQLLSVVTSARVDRLLLAWVIFGTGLLFAAWRWHLMLRFGGNVIHPGATIRAAIIGHCSHTFLFGAAGGDVVKSGIYARWYGLKMSEVLAAAPLDRLMALVGAVVFGSCMMVLGAVSGGFADLGGRDLIWPIAWVAMLFGLVVLVIGGIYRWKGTQIAALDRFRSTLQDGGKELWADRSTLVKSLVAAFCVHACLSFTMVCCLASVTQSSISWISMLWLFPVLSLIS